LPNVPTRPGTFSRAAHTTLLPDHWHVIAMAGGAQLFHVEGSPIPDTLAASFGPPGTGAVSSDLPFDDSSLWLVDLDAAISVGMAVRIPLDNPATPIDQLFVLGVQAQTPPLDAAGRLQTAFRAHQYTNGLGFLAPATPTNNTSVSRSAWRSAPVPPTPSEVDDARSRYQPASPQNAALMARALGVDGSISLGVADFGLDDQQSAVLVMQRQLWNALEAKPLSRFFTRWSIPPGAAQAAWQTQDDPAAQAMLKDHTLGWVRGRGTLPTLRVGNQPYGLLTTTSLTGWTTDPADATAPLATWLRTFREYFRAAVASAPRVMSGDADPDSTVTNILQRLPVSQAVMVRKVGDAGGPAVANEPLPAAPIPGLPQDSQLFLSVPAVDATRLRIPFVGDGLADQGGLLKWIELFSDSIAVLDQSMTPQAWVTKYQPIFGAPTFPGAPPPDIFLTLVSDAFHEPQETSASVGVATFIICGAFAFSQNQNDPAFQRLVQMRLPEARTFLAQLEELAAVDPDNYDPILREVLDVASHRFDAWVTSLAARRLDQMRAAKPQGAVIGGYGWVEDLSPRTDLSAADPPPAGFASAFAGPRQTYIHAPSLHHAATAAVLRAGFDSHLDARTLAVNLESRRVRVATALAEGVRNGQSIGALLGYRFERGLHDAGQDALIEGLRQDHPLPLLPGQDEGGPGAREAIAARNVVDGLDLYRNQDAVRAQFAGNGTIASLLDDLTDAMDAFGDLLLAESVHHLVGGNPLRAGLAADTVGRGEPPPDRFDVARTPRGGRPLSWQVGALLPTAWRAQAAGWRADRPRAQLEPHVEAWAATVLGDASQWRMSCSVVAADGGASATSVSLDTLGVCALDVVCETAGAASTLERRIIDTVAAEQGPGAVITLATAPAADGALGFAELQGLTARIRTVLAGSTPLGPQQLQGSDASPTDGIDTAELGGRISALQAALAAATADLDAATQALSAAAAGPAAAAAAAPVRAALTRLADIGVAMAYPAAGDLADAATVSALSAQAGAVLAAVRPLAASAPPQVPQAGAAQSEILAWLRGVADYAQAIWGRTVPLTRSFTFPATSPYAAAFAADAAPAGATVAEVSAWFRRLARVRQNLSPLFDILAATAAINGSDVGLTVAQLPAEPGARWIGLPYGDAPPAKASLSVVLSTPAPIDTSAAFCGLAFDNWTEQLPGLTSVADQAKGYEAAEVTGVAFTVEGPEAFPPQAILLAVAPDPAAGWSYDVLFDVVQETLDLAKIRTIDLGDLPRLGRVLPALYSGSGLDDVISAAGIG
jgi:hypothetical protein